MSHGSVRFSITEEKGYRKSCMTIQGGVRELNNESFYESSHHVL